MPISIAPLVLRLPYRARRFRWYCSSSAVLDVRAPTAKPNVCHKVQFVAGRSVFGTEFRVTCWEQARLSQHPQLRLPQPLRRLLLRVALHTVLRISGTDVPYHPTALSYARRWYRTRVVLPYHPTCVSGTERANDTNVSCYALATPSPVPTKARMLLPGGAGWYRSVRTRTPRQKKEEKTAMRLCDARY